MHVLVILWWMMCMKSCSRACFALYTVSQLCGRRPYAVIRRKGGIHFVATLAPPKVMRSEETSNARSSLGCSVIDVKRSARRFLSCELV